MILDTFCVNLKPRRRGAVTLHPRPRDRLTPAVVSRLHGPPGPRTLQQIGAGGGRENGTEQRCSVMKNPLPLNKHPCSLASELSILFPTVYIEHTGSHAHSCMPAQTFPNIQTQTRARALHKADRAVFDGNHQVLFALNLHGFRR